MVAPQLAGTVALAARGLGERVSDGAAEALGRLGAHDMAGALDPVSRGRRAAPSVHRPASTTPAWPNGPEPVPGRQTGHDTPGGLPTALAHRLLGAVETTLPDTAFAAGTLDLLGAAARGADSPANGMIAVQVAGSGGHDAFPVALALGRSRMPHMVALTTALVRALAVTDPVAEFLDVRADGPAAAVAAEHGRAWFAVSAVAATIVIRAADAGLTTTPGGEGALVVGVALESVATLLAEQPMPQTWAAARAAEQRAEFHLPRVSSTFLTSDHGRMALLASDLHTIPDAPLPANGLVTAVDGGLVIHTGRDVLLRVIVETLAERPTDDVDPSGFAGEHWDQIVELSYQGHGPSRLLGKPMTVHPDDRDLAFPWPSSLRARVQAGGKDNGGPERYLIRLWEAPPAPTDILRDESVAPSLPAVIGAALIRTDFTDDTHWADALTRMTTPNVSGFVADLDPVDDPRFADAQVPELLTLATPDWCRGQRCLFVVDTTALASPELPVLVIGLHGADRGRTFRVIADQLWAVENNLTLSNMDFADFAAATEDGIHRGF